MRFFTIAASFLAVASASALPGRHWNKWNNNNNDKCLSEDQANDIVSQFIVGLTKTPDVPAANTTLQALLADDFEETSDSILSLQGLPLGGSMPGGKQGYINGVLNAPPVKGVETQEILVAGCTKVLWYWIFTGIGTAEYEVKGFNLFTINDAGQIEAVNLEFNSIAWALNTGFQVISPAGPPPGQ